MQNFKYHYNTGTVENPWNTKCLELRFAKNIAC